jgi:hypothetical protein
LYCAEQSGFTWIGIEVAAIFRGIGVNVARGAGLGQGVMEGYGVQVGFLIRIVGVGGSVEVGRSVGEATGEEFCVFETGITYTIWIGGKRVLDTDGQITTPTATKTATKKTTNKAMISF